MDYRSIFTEITHSIGSFRIYDVQSKGATILASIRGKDRKRYDFEIDFRPYFFVPKVNLPYHLPFLEMEKAQKIVLNHPGEVRKEREEYSYTYEADILYDFRAHFDILQDFPEDLDIPPRIWYLDIEVYNKGEKSIPLPTEVDKIINAISIYDTYSQKFLTIAVSPNGQDTGKLNLKDRYIVKVRSEEHLLKFFLSVLNDIKPDIISGWNIIGFDIRFLVERLEVRYKDLLPKLSPFFELPRKSVNPRDNSVEYEIPGYVVLDFMLLYKKYGDRLPSYSLEYVSQHELKEGKVKYEGSLDNLWQKDFSKFLEYNLEDVNLVRKLEEKLSFIYLVDLMKATTKAKLYSFNFDNTLKVGDMLIMGYIRPHSVMKTKSSASSSSSGYKGAFVRKPKIGLYYDYIIDFDASSMYPSIIRTLNISPDTFLCRVVEDWDFVRFKLRPYLFNREQTLQDSHPLRVITVEGTMITQPAKELKDWLYKETGGDNFTVAINGAIFRTDKVGVLKLIEDDLAKLREVNKDTRKVFGKLIAKLTS